MAKLGNLLTIAGRLEENARSPRGLILSRKSQESLEKVFDQLLAAIDLCTGARLRVPALILLYSAIDVTGWLDSDEEKVELRFTKWVDTYLLPGSSLKCTALDLYGARCGLVHNYSSGSNLSRSGRATQIGYAWQPTTALRLEELVRAKSALDALVGQGGLLHCRPSGGSD